MTNLTLCSPEVEGDPRQALSRARMGLRKRFDVYFHDLCFFSFRLSHRHPSFPKLSDFASNLTQFTICLHNTHTFCTVEHEFGRFFRTSLIMVICKQMICNFQKYFGNVLVCCVQNFIKKYQILKELFKVATSGV